MVNQQALIYEGYERCHEILTECHVCLKYDVSWNAAVCQLRLEVTRNLVSRSGVSGRTGCGTYFARDMIFIAYSHQRVVHLHWLNQIE